MQNREKELKLLRKENKADDESTEFESERDIPITGRVRTSKSIGELYEALWQSTSKRLVINYYNLISLLNFFCIKAVLWKHTKKVLFLWLNFVI